MTEQELIEALENSEALRKGHFKLSSGRHSDTYIQCALLLEDPQRAVEAGKDLAAKVKRELPAAVELVLSPALGALLIGFTTALALKCDMIFAEREDGEMNLRRGFCVPKGALVLLVEDVITTAGSVLELAKLVEEAGAIVAGIACVVQRGEVSTEGYPLVSLVNIPAESFDPEDCPQCAEDKVLDAPGSRFNA